MSDTAQRLAASLAERYRIERELGQGGMATVYLAHDLKHNRNVAVKVLRPELAESLGAGRFLREIEIAAQLSHPHILPLYDSGQAGGFLYYVMPYVEGESLRAKLVREGALAPSEAARYLREVADALAYAHARGVVHRDVKPENVMLSGRHALVMDFGIAKAVSEAGGAGLTTVGVTIGTPSYMAPEQAVADPNVDHRADLYALGVMGYEMITGRTPFAGMTPQQVLAAHVTRTPQPLSDLAPACPPTVAALVMRCLAKAPAERPQTAAELVPLLEGAATPSGGIAAQDPTLVSGGTQAALRRAHPVRLMATYGVAGAVALAAAWFAVQRLGLADWVFTGAVALVAAGVPVMLMTGHHERRRVLARTTAVALTPPETSVSRWFTWRRSLQGAVMGFGLLALGAGAYTGMRVLGIGPVGTLVASGKLATRERVILADFESHAADTTLGASLTEALRVDLSQSPTVRLVEAGDVARVLTQMQRSDEHGLPTALAREVAERAGVKAVVAGKIDPVGAGYVLSASLLSAADGNILVAVRETADDASGLLKAIDRLSAKLRERIGESLVTIRANPSLEQVTTASLPALKLYTEGARLVDEERNREAVRVLRGAIAIDTGFAMAYRKLAVALSNSGSSTEEVVAAATHALHLRDRLTDVERNLTEGFYYDVVEYDEARQDAAYRAVLAVDPDNLTALNNLARLRAFQRRMTETDSLASRAFRTDQNLNLALFIVRARLAEGHGAAARAAVAQIVPALAQVPGARAQIEADIALAERNDTASLRLLEAWRTAPGLDSTRLLEAERLSAWLFESHGQLREAERHLREQERIGEQTGQPWDAVAAAANRAAFEARYRGRPEAALTSIRSALDRHPLDSMPPGNWPYVDLARAYTASGRPDLARRVLTEWERRVPAAQRAAERVTGLAYGDVLAAEGKVDAAARQYADANRRMSLCGVCGLAEMAALADRAGRADSAIALYRTLIDAPAPLYRVSTESQSLAPAYKRLGELYEAKGDRKQAAAYYGRFVDLWKDADPELQPGVREVRGRLAKLAQEPGT